MNANDAARRVSATWYKDRLFLLYILVTFGFATLLFVSVFFNMGIVALLTSFVGAAHYVVLALARSRRVIQELIQGELAVPEDSLLSQSGAAHKQKRVLISQSNIPVQDKPVPSTMYRFGGSQCPPPPTPEELDDRWDTQDRDSGIFNI